MAGIFPFIINSMLGGILGNQSNMMSGNQGNNNDVMNILNGLFVNQGNLNNFNGMNNNYGNNNNNNDVMSMLNAVLSNQGNQGNQGNISMNNGNNNDLGGRKKSNKRNSSNKGVGLDLTKNKNKKNNNRRNNSDNGVNNEFINTFNQIFNQTFAAVVNNQDIIENIVDTVLNSDIVGGMISQIEKIDGMSIELRDYDDKYLIEGRLCGVNKKDIDLDYEDEILTIKVKNNQTFTNGRNTIVGIVQPNTAIEKKFTVKNADANRISATFKEDILRVCLPKKQNTMEIDTIIDVDNYILD